MPELPEVETVRRGLQKYIVGKKIIKVQVETGFAKKIIPSVRMLKKALIGDSVSQVWRRAKLLVLFLGGGKSVLVHLKMTGQFIFVSQKGSLFGGGHPIERQTLPNKFTRVQIEFASGEKLYFNDIRKFGFLKLVNNESLENEIAKYGPEPLTREFNLLYFKHVLKSRPKRKIKQLLLEQNLIAGLGNIYADEALFQARINPERLAGGIKGVEADLLFKKIQSIIIKAIKYKGTTISDYVHATGNKGAYQKFLKVYGRSGESCYLCGAKITKIKLGGRSSSFCPVCQK